MRIGTAGLSIKNEKMMRATAVTTANQISNPFRASNDELKPYVGGIFQEKEEK